MAAKNKVHPLAFKTRQMYRDDLKAGHKDAAEYWRGQASAYFVGNPVRNFGGKLYHYYSQARDKRSARVKCRNIRARGMCCRFYPEYRGYSIWIRPSMRNNPFDIPTFTGGLATGLGLGIGAFGAKRLMKANPRARWGAPWDPQIWEEDNDDNPLRQFRCSVCGAYAPKKVLPHGKFEERMRWLRSHYKRSHPQLWPWERSK